MESSKESNAEYYKKHYPHLYDKLWQQEGKPKRILALDGGGIRGALTLGYLEKLESLLRKRFNKPDLKLCDYFDLIGGTSTGAIISACLATGMDVKTVIGLYQEFGKEIFGKRRFNLVPRSWTTFRAIFKASYDSEKIESLLKRFLNDVAI